MAGITSNKELLDLKQWMEKELTALHQKQMLILRKYHQKVSAAKIAAIKKKISSS